MSDPSSMQDACHKITMKQFFLGTERTHDILHEMPIKNHNLPLVRF